MLFGEGILCRILYCLFCCLLFKCKLKQINDLGWEERAGFSAKDYSKVCFIFFLWEFRIDCFILLWNNLGLPYWEDWQTAHTDQSFLDVQVIYLSFGWFFYTE